MPRSRSSSITRRAVSNWAMTLVSVISRTSPSSGSPWRSSVSRTTSTKPGSSRLAGVTLTATVKASPLARHVRALGGGGVEHPGRDPLHEAGLVGEREERVRRHESETGVLPADQRLDGQDLPRAQVELRLVVEHQGVSSIASWSSSARRIWSCSSSRFWTKHDEGDVAELGPVHGDVGAPDQPGAVGGVGRGDGDADAGADARTHRVQRERLTQALGAGARPRRTRSRPRYPPGPPRIRRHRGARGGRPRAAVPCSRDPSWRRSSSPAGWPNESLISLNRSRSMKRKARLWLSGSTVVLREEGVEDAEQVAPVPQPGELVGHGLAMALPAEDLQAPDREDEPDADDHEGDDRQGEGEPGDRAQGADDRSTRAAADGRGSGG